MDERREREDEGRRWGGRREKEERYDEGEGGRERERNEEGKINVVNLPRSPRH